MRLPATLALAAALAFGGATPARAHAAGPQQVEARLRLALQAKAPAAQPLVVAPQSQAGPTGSGGPENEAWKTAALVGAGVLVVFVGGTMFVGYMMGTFPPRGN